MSSPPPKPVSEPFVPTTRWHGMTIGIGFEAMVLPTARNARGLPARRAISAYVATWPRGIAYVSISTSRRNDVGTYDRSSCTSNRVRFPDARIEFEDRDRQEQHRDIEVVTPHYRGAHAAAVARSGFQSYAGGLRLKTSGRRGGRGLDPRLAEELLE